MLGTSRAIATTLASVLVVAPALAQPKASEKDKARANELVKQAIAKSQAKQHLAAIDLYLEAYAVVPLPTLLSNIGTEYQSAKKPVEALKYFCMYLDKDPTGPLHSYATAQAKVLQTELGNATDGDDVCAPTRQDSDDAGGAADASADEGLTGTADLASSTPRPADPGKGLKIAGIVTGVAGLAALGVGAYYGLEAKKISDDISNHTDPEVPWRDDIREYQDLGQSYENRQIIGLVAGGALVVGGGVLYLLGRSKSSAERMTVVPTANADSAGVTMIGRF